MRKLAAALALAGTLMLFPSDGNAKQGWHTPVSSDGALLAESQAAPYIRPFRGSGETDPAAAPAGARAAPAAPRIEQPSTVIGADGRRRVDPRAYPTRAVVEITFSGPDGTYGCTGWLIGPDTVVTAGHCVHEGPGGDWFPTSSYEIVAGRSLQKAPFGVCRARQLYSVTGWVKHGQDDYDYGAIKLDCRVGKRTGWFGYGPVPDVKGRTVRITGYPCDKPRGTAWSMPGEVSRTDRRRIGYRIDTFGCQSGAPVFEMRSKLAWGVGVHAYGSAAMNSATRINKEVASNLSAWRKAK